ncbi:DEAD/DEAH box helicase [Pseudomonas serbica]|uniref:DEAD/DEAH box helicase n=1 Tax=Pseudomonas serbica TaxID=2965074 RepID=UPI00237AAC36|nr:DEAD/DEAH box helicase [Pseudomonas serbica]
MAWQILMKRPKRPTATYNPSQSSIDLELIPAVQVEASDGVSNPPQPPTSNYPSKRKSKVSQEPLSENSLKKVHLLMDTFHVRRDIYAKSWISSRTGKPGYAPACSNYRAPNICKKYLDYSFDCKTCKHRVFAPLTDQVMYKHLTKAPHIGIFPLLLDNTCYLVAVDFDKEDWRTDVLEFLASCKLFGIPTTTEISRSGNGAHVWLFFSEKVPAINARKLALGLMSHAQQRTGKIEFDSYDRLFPNQDFMPAGGIGNLIAMPCQFLARLNNFSVFVDPNDDFKPYYDQIAYLKTIQKLSSVEVSQKISEVVVEGEHELGVQFMKAGDDHHFWSAPKSAKKLKLDDLPKVVTIVQDKGLQFDLKELPRPFFGQLARLAAFPNPAFYIAEAGGFSTWGKPMVERRCVVENGMLSMPRGCLDAVLDFIKSYDVPFLLKDERSLGRPIDVTFTGTLRDDQAEALKAMLEHDVGTLKANPSFGKTVIGAALIASRQVSTLIVVHRRYLIKQWRLRLKRFLNLEDDQIGQLGGPKSKPTGIIDIVMMPSLGRLKDIQSISEGYGQVIIDECQHLAAKTFEEGLNKLKSRYFVGLSAKPKRSDGRQPLVFMCAGNIRYISKRPLGAPQDLTVKSKVRKKNIDLPATANTTELHSYLVDDQERTRWLVEQALAAYSRGRQVLLLTGRKAHSKAIAEALDGKVDQLFVLSSEAKEKAREDVIAAMEALPVDTPRVLVSTWQLVGEGFDHAPLNTLILCLPFSWEGTVEQCAGRLDRYLPDKLDAEIFDPIDEGHPLAKKMWKARQKAYKAIGYRIIDERATLEMF